MVNNKLIERAKLKSIVSELKSQGKKIVFTNGCFDILHIGHIRYLREARQLGDTLLIGLNSDNSVAKIKPGRPLMPEENRAEVLSALDMVDYITIFDESTPYELIDEIKPDVLVKGSDWKKEAIVGRELVKEVHTIAFVKGASTSEIINKIQKSKIKD